MKFYFLFALIILVFTKCGTTVKTSTASNANLLSHKTIAILPFEVRFDLRKLNQKEFTETDMAKVKQFMSLGLQAHLYHWLQSYSAKHPFTVQIQHCDSTTQLLSLNKIRFVDVYTMDRKALAKLLGVDAVITPQVLFTQPNSESAASVVNAVSLLTPLSPLGFNTLATQEMDMQVLINSNSSDTAIWKFKSKVKSGERTKLSKAKQKENILYPLFDNIDEMLVGFIKKFPYKKTLK